MASSKLPNQRNADQLVKEIAENKEDIQLIWLDGKICNSPDFLRTRDMLIELNPAVQFYSNYDRCCDLIKSVKYEQILLVVSGAFAQQLLSQLHKQNALVAIFIFCSKPERYEALMQQYNKVFGIFTDQDCLLGAIRKKMYFIKKQTLAFSLFDRKQKTMKDLSQESASFILSQILFDVLRQMPQNHQSKQDMLGICRAYYQNNEHELRKIKEFETSYCREEAIAWYTDECFLYKLLNKALRTEDVYLLHTFRFFIIDLCGDIERESHKLKNKGILKVYRGTQITKDELQKLLYNIGTIISTNGFLSTSRNINVSIEFARPDAVKAGFESVLFEIKADTSLKTITFVNVGDRSRIDGEEEVLFGLTSLFKIAGVKYDLKLKLWKVQLYATDEGAEKVEEYLALSRQRMEESSPIIYFGHLLLHDLSQVDRAGSYFDMLLRTLPSNHPDIASVYNSIGTVYDTKDEYNAALESFEIAYEMRRKLLRPDHPQIAGSLSCIGGIYESKEDYDKALKYYEQALSIYKKNYFGDHIQKAVVLKKIGRVYNQTGDPDTALNYLQQALKMYKNTLPNPHGEIAACLGQIGTTYEEKDELTVALDYYYQQLNMDEQCLPFDHPDLSGDIEWIADAYVQMDQVDKALEFCQEKLNKQKDRLGENHPSIAKILITMAETCEDDNVTRAHKYYEEALSILSNANPPQVKEISECLGSIAHLYYSDGSTESALEYLLKALELARQTLPSDHVDLAIVLKNVGLAYAALNNRSQARRYFKESLSIYKLNYELGHETIEECEQEMAKLNDRELSSKLRSLSKAARATLRASSKKQIRDKLITQAKAKTEDCITQ